jgi:hypothetical protein
MPPVAEVAPNIFHLTPHLIGIWVAAFLTLAIYSFLYADNPVYKFAEHLFVGASAGYSVITTLNEAVIPDLINPLFHPEKANLAAPHYLTIIPGILGLMMFSRFFPKIDWLARWPMALVLGVASGMAIPASIQANLLKQMNGTMQPLVPISSEGHVQFVAGFEHALLLVGVICVLSYFFFSLEHKGPLRVTSRMGVWFLMIAFGAGFGNTVMARISLLIGRVQFLLYDWLPTLRH